MKVLSYKELKRGNKKNRIQTDIDGSGFFDEIGEMLVIKKKEIRKGGINITNSMIYYIKYKQFNCYGYERRMIEDWLP